MAWAWSFDTNHTKQAASRLIRRVTRSLPVAVRIRSNIFAAACHQSRPALLRFAGDRRGTTAMLTALLAPVLIGSVGLAVDVGYWQMAQRSIQGAADQAAFSAATAALAGANATTEGKIVAGSMGFVDGQNRVTVAVNNPPTQGSNIGNSSAWEVIIRQPQQLYVAGLFLSSAPTVTGRAVASASTNACILGLDPTAPDTVLFDNNGQMLNPNCIVYSDSSSASALDCNNNCTIASPTYAVGGHLAYNNGRLSGSPNVTGAPHMADPYANVLAGTPGPCTRLTTVTGGSISPGHYCGGIMVSGSTLTMASGVYYIDTQFGIQDGATLNANPPGGVTIIINGTYCIGYGDCQAGHGIGNNSTLNITAQTTGPYAGIAIFGPRNSTPAVTQEFSDNSHNNIQGAVYFPSQTVQFDNNSTFNSSLCTQIVADKVHIENNANPSTNCAGTGVASTATAKMVE